MLSFCGFHDVSISYSTLYPQLWAYIRIWCKPRSTEWWTGVITGLYGDEWWRENLRMTRDTFEILCNELRPHIERQDTRYRKSISVEVHVRVAITIWRLGTNIEYQLCSDWEGLQRAK